MVECIDFIYNFGPKYEIVPKCIFLFNQYLKK